MKNFVLLIVVTLSFTCTRVCEQKNPNDYERICLDRCENAEVVCYSNYVYMGYSASCFPKTQAVVNRGVLNDEKAA
jgi:hypothetical protein